MCTHSCPLRKILTQKSSPQAVETYMHHKDGYRIPVSVKVIPWHTSDGRLAGAIEIFTKNIKVDDRAQSRIKTLEKLAYIDELTGLPNRRFILSRIETRLDELRRYNWSFGLLFLDIDKFKQLNDRFGHKTGDQVLKMVASTLNQSKRNSDVIGRFGGEEFIAIVTNVDRNRLLEVAERLRHMVGASSLRGDFSLSITISIGAAIATIDDTTESVIERADINMYNSKQSGRNRVTG
jgi:diguanylate cyclase (GGDEF)-like protein